MGRSLSEDVACLWLYARPMVVIGLVEAVDLAGQVFQARRGYGDIAVGPVGLPHGVGEPCGERLFRFSAAKLSFRVGLHFAGVPVGPVRKVPFPGLPPS